MFDQTRIVLSLAADTQTTIPFIYVVYALLAVPALFIYLLPSNIADWRKRKNRRAIFWLNLLLGWTFVGWTVALIWAISEAATIFPPEPVIHLGYYDRNEGRKGAYKIFRALDRAFTDVIREVRDARKHALLPPILPPIFAAASFGLAALLPLGAPWSYIEVVIIIVAWFWIAITVLLVCYLAYEFLQSLRSHFVTYDAFTCKVCGTKRKVRHPAATKKCNGCGAVYQIVWDPVDWCGNRLGGPT